MLRFKGLVVSTSTLDRASCMEVFAEASVRRESGLLDNTSLLAIVLTSRNYKLFMISC